jgi:hypothetical protein
MTDREAIRHAVAKKLDTAEDRGLPMPHTREGRVSLEEWEEHWQRYNHELRITTYYARRFHLPPTLVVDKVWKELGPHLGPLKVEQWTMTPLWTPDAEDVTRLEHVGRTALVVVLDACVGASRLRELVTFTKIFEIVASRFSDHYFQAKTPGADPIRHVADMTIEMVKNCRRDLLVRGLEVDTLWKIVKQWSLSGENPLFGLEEHYQIGTEVHLKEAEALERFDEILKEHAGPSTRSNESGGRNRDVVSRAM